ncbi:MAG: hypothetical protein ACR2QM_13090 [Longimicrobiales bacterium]
MKDHSPGPSGQYQATGTNGERGMALVVVLLVVMVVGALVSGAAVVSANHMLVNRIHDRQSTLDRAADAGLQVGRAIVEADPSLYPTSGHRVIENGVSIPGPGGDPNDGLRRWTSVGPSRGTAGFEGPLGSIVSVVESRAGQRAVRRQELRPESFASYGIFVDQAPNGVRLGSSGVYWGSVHANAGLVVDPSGATFHAPVHTASTLVQTNGGTFHSGYREGSPRIDLPTATQLGHLRGLAKSGGLYFEGDTSQGQGEATMRIEFVAVDLNGDGDRADPAEGFIRVYRNLGNPGHVTAEEWSWDGAGPDLQYSNSCGAVGPDGQFYTMDEYRTGVDGTDWGWSDAAADPGRRCHLGGDPRLNNPDGFQATDAFGGSFEPWPHTPDPALVAAVGATAARYLHPIHPVGEAPDFTGVIFVDGKVALSGTVAGRVTVAATDEITLADDLVYATDPGAPDRNCRDILGIFTAADVVIADNAINTSVPTSGDSWTNDPRSFDDTPSEFLHGSLLALGSLVAEDYEMGPTWTEPCDLTPWGRGCLRITGSIGQGTLGAIRGDEGAGYLPRFSYDRCGADRPPPHFPTTGRFAKGEYFQVDPSNFDLDAYWKLIAP